MVADTNGAVVSHRWLKIEFAALYIGAPLAMAIYLPPGRLFQALVIFSLAGIALLYATGGFQWRVLVRGWSRLPWLEILGITLATLFAGWAILATLQPDALFSLIRNRPEFLPFIWVFYPLLSALPQELIFRPLFFHRYGAILPHGQAAIALNAAVFAFAHLMYWSLIVAVMTFVGGWIFGRAYLRHGFPSAWVLHAVAGNVLFAVGMGAYFYTGNVVRPF
ncbi:CPBP family intramembrane metalloprotease [Paracoccus sp. 1_MG-2023]|uniref:CPBP family intramembrane glutamic endopeptidase n=1 Tax=unclassified Paracoccus (in: a-proteobacteria) TaxID=2688777 RepID=UPI001C09EA55|nr:MULTISPECIES: CPBP family intramembrane glutamic endopeptidase [unclassified Paracoccus (in: a-proteobacteria)]MBU2958159.1 CPBP family intramembrane metalloprotease [Paracoccus sp. C2R09]MDO6668286.1 CPBP family intramembrane metalloprotease [Paracoccus sp. 1_MG-2023]